MGRGSHAAMVSAQLPVGLPQQQAVEWSAVQGLWHAAQPLFRHPAGKLCLEGVCARMTPPCKEGVPLHAVHYLVSDSRHQPAGGMSVGSLLFLACWSEYYTLLRMCAHQHV